MATERVHLARATAEAPSARDRPPAAPAAGELLRLQRQAGNRATGALVVQRTGYGRAERQASRTSPGAAARHPAGPLPPTMIVLSGFAADGADLKPAHLALLDGLFRAESLATRARVTSVVGYCDSVGGEGHNSPLRLRRAEAALAYLGAHGMTGGAATAAGAGEYLGGNDSELGRATNRAVVITLVAAPAPPPRQDAPIPEPDAGPRRDMDAGVPDDGPHDASLPGGTVAGPRDLDAGLPPPPAPPTPVEIDVGDAYDATGWLEGFTRTGEVYMSDLNSMVANVLQAAGDRPIARLDVRAHGNPTVIVIGSTEVNAANFGTYQPVFARLAGHFAPGGFVHLESCQVGQNQPLMRLLAATLGVPVYSATGYYYNVFPRFNSGDYVVCQPDGRCSPTTRP
ncbi:hypothetical protein R8Z50_16155 [Longispora sp. K20-0274]|uniref:hypothetical protein n=1 Tax=Longispora sp. K20-0274 TaxID=3088255 RepID=UPI00399A3245